MSEQKTCPFRAGAAQIAGGTLAAGPKDVEAGVMEYLHKFSACTPDCKLWTRISSEDGVCGAMGTEYAIRKQIEDMLEDAHAAEEAPE